MPVSACFVSMDSGSVHSKATVTGHQIVPADRQLKIAQLGVCWEAPSFQESLEPHVTEDTSSVQVYITVYNLLYICIHYSDITGSAVGKA